MNSFNLCKKHVIMLIKRVIIIHTAKEINKIIQLLEKYYPIPYTDLKYIKDYELLFAARLAAQCTDARVNTVTPALFIKYPSLEAFASADINELEKMIFSCGFYKTKARDIIAAATILLTDFNGIVPDNMEDLLKLPGVGRKTANLLLGDIFNKPAVVVDTHCIRLSNRIGLVNTKNPDKIESELRKILPPDKSSDFCHRLVLHGRAVCTARKPRCEKCCINKHCLYYKDR